VESFKATLGADFAQLILVEQGYNWKDFEKELLLSIVKRNS
jgi:hypothetical protein